MKTITYCMLVGVLSAACSSSPQSEKAEVKKFETTGSIERMDERINKLIADSAEIEILASGFSWSEGPVWVSALDAVVFTDVPENIAYKWDEVDLLTEYLNPSGYTGQKIGKEGANGLILDLQGNLVLCHHGDRRLARMKAPVDNPDETYETIAGEYRGKKFNSPNDVTQNSQGTFFFTDPPYGLKDDDKRQIDFQGVYKVDKTGDVVLLVDSLSFPNGVALSPDEKTLYVAVSDPKSAKYYAYDLDENGDITGGKVLLDVTSLVSQQKPGLPDGLCVDERGNLFATGPGGVLVITPQGEHLGTIVTGQATANCTLNADNSTLYMTASMHLMRIKLK